MAYRTWIVDRSTLSREGLKRLLEHSAFEVVFDAPDLEHALRAAGHGVPELVLVALTPGFVPEEQEARAFGELCGRFPASAVVAMADEMSLAQMKAAMRSGAQACLIRDITAEIFEHALLLVMSGQKVLPKKLLAGLIDARAARVPASGPDGAVDLSQQERNVLLALTSGMSNKEIASRLDVAEGTVKTHVKTVLKKLGAQNRTEAAVWAYRHGLGTDLPDEDADPLTGEERRP